jgi:hypothetical protein
LIGHPQLNNPYFGSDNSDIFDEIDNLLIDEDYEVEIGEMI